MEMERKSLEAFCNIYSEPEINTPDDLLHVMSRFGKYEEWGSTSKSGREAWERQILLIEY